MSPTEYDRLRALYLDLFELTLEEQRRALREMNLEPSLRRELEELLGQDLDANLFAEGRLGELGARLADAPRVDDELPASIGDYRVLHKLGEGGMGVVYAARRAGDDTVVAVKVLRPDVAGGWLSKRFQREAKVLQRLRHPGIAAFYESGEARVDYGSDTRVLPYLAMECVRGESLLRHARRARLGDRERLELMAHVCDAVQHAHEAGVVHRDLKPENILVVDEGASDATRAFQSRTSSERVGQPKVLDFGIARARAVDLNTLTVTQSGALLGTVPYMSPEQVGGEGERVDERSDVYSLGVVLFELLAGRLPYHVKGRPLLEAARVIQEEEPTRLGSVAARLRGNVEVVVAKALEKDPERRYASAAELAHDLRSHLRGEPVLARPATWSHQVGKFARRHKALVGTVSGTVLALAVGLVATLWFAVGQSRARTLADANAVAAHRLAYRMGVDGAAADLLLVDGLGAEQRLANVPSELRGWEWYHLMSRIDRSHARVSLPRSSSGQQLSFSADGGTIRVCSSPEATATLSSWSLADGALDERVEAASARMLVGPAGGRASWIRNDPYRVEIEDLADGSRVRLPLKKGELLSLCSDPEVLLVFGVGVVRLVSMSTGRELGELQGLEDGLKSLHVTTQGDRAAWFVTDDVLQVTSLDGSFHWETRVSHRGPPRLSPDGELVAFAPLNSSVVMVFELNEVGSNGAKTVYEEHRDEVRACAFSPDGTLIATAGEDRAVHVWDPRTGERRNTIPFSGVQVTALAFSPDGGRLAGLVSQRDGLEIMLWAVASEEGHVVPHDYPLRALALGSDGQLAYAAGDSGRVRATDLLTGYEVARYRLARSGTQIRTLIASPTGRWVAVSGRTSRQSDGDSWLSVLDPVTGEARTLLEGEGGRIGIAVSPDGGRLAACVLEKLTLFETDGWEPVASRSIGSSTVNPVIAFGPRNERIAVAGDAGEIVLLDAHELNELRRWEAHPGRIWSLAFHPDGATLVSGGSDRVARIWALDDTSRNRSLPQDRIVHSVSFSPDGERLVLGGADRVVRLFETQDYTELVRLQEHDDAVRVAEFTPDGRHLVSCAGDGILCIRGFESVAEVAELRREYQVDRARLEPRVDALLAENGPQGAWDSVEHGGELTGREREIALQILMGRAAAARGD